MACVHVDSPRSAGSPGSSSDSACGSAESAISNGSLSQSGGTAGERASAESRALDTDDGYFTSSTDHRMSVSSPAASLVDQESTPGNPSVQLSVSFTSINHTCELVD